MLTRAGAGRGRAKSPRWVLGFLDMNPATARSTASCRAVWSWPRKGRPPAPTRPAEPRSDGNGVIRECHEVVDLCDARMRLTVIDHRHRLHLRTERHRCPHRRLIETSPPSCPLRDDNSPVATLRGCWLYYFPSVTIRRRLSSVRSIPLSMRLARAERKGVLNTRFTTGPRSICISWTTRVN